MDKTQECVIFIMGCMALFQLMDQNFNSPILEAFFSNLDCFAMDRSIALKSA
jgi:hypothetical protein